MANHQQFQLCYQNWMAQQKVDHDELLQGLTNFPTDLDYLQLITKKAINHFENYHTVRAQLAKHDGLSFLAPTWGTTFENSSLWIGGCRPSLIIRLVYVLCGSQINAHLAEVLDGVTRGNLGDLSNFQLKSVDALHIKTIKEEDKLTSALASVQEKVADEPIALLAYNCKKVGESSEGEAVDKAMDTHAFDVYKIIIEADKLRLDILKRMIDILTPLQAVELLLVSKKLNLCLHEWGKRRDFQMGITQLLNTQIPSTSRDPPSE
ncbi:putative transcription factor TGA like domain-containing protein [Helianthus anomalus]